MKKKEHRCIRIAIANQKGGIGKTTTALCLASGLQRRGYKVLFIDTDPQKNSTFVYKAKVEDQETLADIFFGGLTALECIQTTEQGDIIAGDGQLQNADTMIAPGPKMYKYLKNALSEVEDRYDFIVFDTPPRTGILLGNVLLASDYVVIPVTCDSFGIQGVLDFNRTIEEYKEDNPSLKVAGLLNIKYKGRESLTRDIEDHLQPELAKEMGTIVFKSRIRESVKCKEAQALQIPLDNYASACTTARDYYDFISELLKEVE